MSCMTLPVWFALACLAPPSEPVETAGADRAKPASAGRCLPTTPGALGCEWSPECSTPGVELRLEEQPPDPATPGVTDYMFRMSGFPLGHSYRFLIKHSGTLEISAIGEGFEAAEGGALIGGAKTTWGGQPASELRELQFSLSNTLPGETWHVAAVSTDGQVRADAVACPRPIEARQGSRRLWFELIDPAAKVFLAQGAGFTPGEKVISVTTSGSEVLTSSPSVCDDGHLPPEIVLPATKGKRGGRGTWTVRTSSGELTLAFPWGREAFR